MKILFDHQAFALQSYGGISRYYVRLVQGLAALGERPTVVAPLHINRYLSELSSGLVRGRELASFPSRHYRSIALANRAFCAGWVHLVRPAVLHETYYTMRPVKGPAAARIVTVYDMIHERFSSEFPKGDQTSAQKRQAVARADHVISISHNTKRDLCQLFGTPESKVSVVHLGFETLQTRGGPDAAQETGKPFLLYVGQRAGYKNFSRVLRAVAASPRLAEAFDIVAFGGGPFSPAERDLIASLKLRAEGVKQLGGGDDVLRGLYRTARAFVYPSLYEGFGLPPLEAMANDCPVVASATSSMPEVIGDAGEMFDPVDVDAQAAAITRVVFDDAHRASLIARGRERLEHFSWHHCAVQTRDVYRRVTGMALPESA